MKIDNKFNLGDLLKESVTGFEGVVMCVSLYSTGCLHYGLQSKKLKDDGQVNDWQYFDQSQLSLIEEKAVTFNVPKGTTSGAFPNPPQQ